MPVSKQCFGEGRFSNVLRAQNSAFLRSSALKWTASQWIWCEDVFYMERHPSKDVMLWSFLLLSNWLHCDRGVFQYKKRKKYFGRFFSKHFQFQLKHNIRSKKYVNKKGANGLEYKALEIFLPAFVYTLQHRNRSRLSARNPYAVWTIDFCSFSQHQNEWKHL